MSNYAEKLSKSAASVLGDEAFLAAMKCYPPGHTRRRMTRGALLGAAGLATAARGKQDDHTIEGQPMPRELALGLTNTRGFVFELSTMTGKAKVPPLKIVPLGYVTAVASQPGRTLHIAHTLIWLRLADGDVLALETAQGHARNGEQFVTQLLTTASPMEIPSEGSWAIELFSRWGHGFGRLVHDL